MASSSRPRQRVRPPANPTATSISPAQSRPRDSLNSILTTSENASDDEDDPNFPLPQFYNTSFTAHRVSPLYIGKEGNLSNRRLRVIAARLRDLLVGDVVRGVEVGLGEDTSGILGRYGGLEGVGLRWVALRKVLDIEMGEGNGGDDDRPESRDLSNDAVHTNRDWGAWRRRLEDLRGRNRRALQIELTYENATATGLLLPALGREGGEEGGDQMRFFVGEGGGGAGKEAHQRSQFLDMPLLLLRMPAPLKSVIADFLATSFDCRVSLLRLGTRSMVRSLESWIRTVGLPSRGPLAKDVTFSLGFHVPAPEREKEREGDGSSDEETRAGGEGSLGLKSIDVSIPVSELRKFVEAGRELEGQDKRPSATAKWGWEADPRKRRKLAGRLYEEGWEWRTEGQGEEDSGSLEKEEQPFTEAMGRYIDQHLGLNLFHPGVRVTKMSCGGFVMSEGRLKVFPPDDLGEGDASSVTPSSPGQRGAALELLGGLVEKATVRLGELVP